MREAGIYIHIPFCAAKCPYCNFYSLPHSQSKWQEYADTLCQVLEDWQGRGVTAKTLYFGGGTPSLLPAELLLQIKNTVCRVFGQPEEITLEANPGLCTPEKLRRLRQGGFDRISFGVQSLEEKELKLLGRLHSPKQAEQAIWQAAQAGFSNLSADVMLAIPGQTEQSLEHTLSRLTALPITHLSSYLLKAEPGTPFYTPDILALTQDEERCRALYLKTVSCLEQAGFPQYEISNFARPGLESKHNLLYWQGKEYLGFGPAAHSFFDGTRFCYPDDLSAFLDSKGTNRQVLEQQVDPLEEGVLLGLRLRRGIDLKELAETYHCPLSRAEGFCRQCVQGGLMERREGRIALTPEGFLVSNEIIVRLLECLEP